MSGSRSRKTSSPGSARPRGPFLRLRRYEIGERIGVGATSEVYQAWVRETGEPVAIKLLHVTRTPAMADSIHREAQLSPRLVHPHIARVHDVMWDAHGPTCLVMELVEGVPLSDIMRSSHPVSSPVAIAIVRPVLRALDYAHREARIAHRDVSPKNIVVGWGGTVKLVDFGVAKLIGAEPTTGLFKGTPRYMSPEQALGADVDGRADVFAVGVILYELLTGRHLFSGETTNEILAHVVAGDPAPAPRTLCAEISATVSDAVMTMIERNREHRVASAADALEALPVWPEGQVLLAALMRELRDEHARSQKVPELPPTPTPAPRPRPGLRALALASLVALLAVGAWAQWQLDRQPGATAPAGIKPDNDHFSPDRQSPAVEGSTWNTSPASMTCELPSAPEFASASARRATVVDAEREDLSPSKSNENVVRQSPRAKDHPVNRDTADPPPSVIVVLPGQSEPIPVEASIPREHPNQVDVPMTLCFDTATYKYRPCGGVVIPTRDPE